QSQSAGDDSRQSRRREQLRRGNECIEGTARCENHAHRLDDPRGERSQTGSPMSALEKRYRRNFIVALVLHLGIIGGIVSVERLSSFGNRTESTPASVEAALIGEEPEGKGT